LFFRIFSFSLFSKAVEDFLFIFNKVESYFQWSAVAQSRVTALNFTQFSTEFCH